MKLHEIYSSPDDIKRAEIQEWLDKDTWEMVGATINRDLTVSVTGHVGIVAEDETFTQLPVRFKKTGSFSLFDGKTLETLFGFPEECELFQLDDCPKLSSLKYAPRKTEGVLLFNLPNLTDFRGVYEIFDMINGEVYFSRTKINNGGIGFLLIPGITKMVSANAFDSNLCDILNKYLGRPEDIFECQAELIDAGFAEYAQL